MYGRQAVQRVTDCTLDYGERTTTCLLYSITNNIVLLSKFLTIPEIIKGSFLYWFRVKKIPDCQRMVLLPYIIAFYRDNDLKKKKFH